jgi:signal transduction histidine kinase
VRRPTLLRQILATQAAIIAACCTLMVAASLVATAVVVRAQQDRSLRHLAAALREGIASEGREKTMPLEDAATEFFDELALPDHRFELLRLDGRLAVGMGGRPDWDSEHVPVEPGTCGTALATGWWRGGRALRSCVEREDADHVVRVVAVDALLDARTLALILPLLVALPVAMIAGASVGRVLMRRRLQVLRVMADAASRLDVGADPRLDVHAEQQELAEVEAAFDRLLARLGAALASERRFSQDASHELRTPLTLLRLRLEQLRGRMSESGAVRADLDDILGDVDALQQLVDSLLLLGRADLGVIPREPVNACDLVRDAAARQRDLDGPAGPPIEVEAPDEILVEGDEPLLARAIGNLVENARRHAGPQARVRLSVLEDGPRVRLVVVDDGPGIPEDLRPTVFERFVRGPRQRASTRGAGLGLAVTRAIVSAHGGDVGTRPSDLGGEEAWITLPRRPIQGSNGRS